ncbi:MAG TPA: GAF domain-containing protein [Terriglobales bacterium]|nr:GAF domain-containing protein [Terriglobales bacterium]
MYGLSDMASQGLPVPVFQDLPESGGRRRSVRQKAHTPTYASFDGISGGMVLDLTEVLNLSEGGMCIQTTTPLAAHRTLNLVLDLSATKTYVNTSGLVVWTDKSGRAGVRFSKLSETSHRQIKEWLFVNALHALSKPASEEAESETDADVLEIVGRGQATREAVDPDDLLVMETEQAKSGTAKETKLPASEALTPEPLQSAVDAPTLNAIQQQIKALGSDLGAALNVLVQRARAITRASGAAIALAQGKEMVCRACSGEAPGLGARFQVGSGFSGECVRTAKVQRCDDSETHAHVDRETCRALGIRSMIAAPVLSSGRVIGLLEVFSPNANAFAETDAIALHRLADIIAKVARRPLPDLEPGISPEAATPRKRENLLLPLTRSNLFLLVTAAVLTVIIIVLLVTWTLRRPAQVVASPPAANQPAQPVMETLEDLRKYAAQGDPVAQYALGARYAQGVDVKQDQAEAVRWFTKAAEQGHVGAQAALGVYYWAGRGVPADLGKAYFWSVLARAGGDEGSKYRVASLTARMSHSQVLEAQQEANDWLRQHQTGAGPAH